MDPNKLNNLNLGDMNHKLVRSDEVDTSNGIVFNPADGTPNLVNPNKMFTDITNILEAALQPDVAALKDDEPEEYEKILEEKFPEFAMHYYATFKKVISGEDIQPLLQMLAQIEKIRSGQRTLEAVEEEFNEDLREKYIYPKFGGKDAMMAEMQKKEKKKAKKANRRRR